MYKSYLSKDVIAYFLIAVLLSYFIGLTLLSFLILLIFSLVLFLFRKEVNTQKQLKKTDQGVLKSPVFGKLLSIRKGVSHEVFGDDLTELKIIIPHFYESGLYLPCALEVDEVIRDRSKEVLRYQKNLNLDQKSKAYGGILLKAVDEKNVHFGMQFIKCFMGLNPNVWVFPGDKGVSGARFGHFPFGGTLLLYLGKDFKINAKDGDRLFAGMTPLANKV